MDYMDHLYGRNMTKINNLENSNVHKFTEINGGLCVITVYDIFPGISVYYNDIHVEKINSNINTKINNVKRYEINHCREGRCECILKDGTIAYMEAGDFAINPFKNSSSESNFPISHYHGVTIYITPSELKEEAHSLQNIFKVDYTKILEKLCDGDKLFIKRATPQIKHIFHEIYHVPEYIVISYLKVKIQELFLYLSTIENKMDYQDREHFAKSNVDIVKNLHSFVIENSQESYTYVELSSMFSIKQTSMKKCYKSVYGETIHDTIQKNRLKKATLLLKETTYSITEIALEIGYGNHAKFSKAFKKMYNISPSQYRKVIALLDTNCLIGEE